MEVEAPTTEVEVPWKGWKMVGGEVGNLVG